MKQGGRRPSLQLSYTRMASMQTASLKQLDADETKVFSSILNPPSITRLTNNKVLPESPAGKPENRLWHVPGTYSRDAFRRKTDCREIPPYSNTNVFQTRELCSKNLLLSSLLFSAPAEERRGGKAEGCYFPNTRA